MASCTAVRTGRGQIARRRIISLYRTLLALSLAAIVSIGPAQTDTTTPLQACGFGTLRAFNNNYGQAATQYSPDGSRVLTWSDAAAYLWDRTTGIMLRTITGDSTILNATFSPDGTRILTVDSTSAKVWDVNTGIRLMTLNSGGVATGLYAPNGSVILIGRTVYNATNGNMMYTISGVGTGGTACFSATSDRFATAGNSSPTAYIFNTGGGGLVATLTGHTGIIRAIRFSPDGTKILTTSDDNTAKLWNGVTGLLTKTYANKLPCAIFTTDSSKVAVSTSFPSYVCQLFTADASATLFRTFTGHTDEIRSAVFSSDGQTLLTASWDGTARLWSVPIGQATKIYSGHLGPVAEAHYSPNQLQIVTTAESSGSIPGDQTIRCWDLAYSGETHTYFGHTNWVNSAVYSADGNSVLTGSSDSTAKIWSRSTNSVVRTFTGHTNVVNSAVYSADTTEVLTASGDGTARLWDASGGTLLRTFTTGVNVKSAQISPDGSKVLTACNDGTVKLWDVATSSVLRSLTGPGDKAVFSPDGTKALIASSSTTNAYVRNIIDDSLVFTLSDQPYGIQAIAWAPDGNSIITAPGNYLELWNASTGALRLAVQVPSYLPTSVSFSVDSTRLVTSGNFDARVWDAQTLALLRTIASHTATVQSAVFSADGLSVLTASQDATAREWRSNVPLEQQVLKGHSDFSKVAISADGTQLLTADGREAKLWDARSGSLVRSFTGHADLVRSVALSPDGTQVLTGSKDKTAKLWNLSTGLVVRTFTQSSSADVAVFAPNGSEIATINGSEIKLWNPTTGALVNTIAVPQTASALAYSPDSTTIAAGGLDNQIQVLDHTTGLPSRIITLGSQPLSVSFSPDGTKIMPECAGLGTRIYDISSGGLYRSFATASTNPRFSPDGSKVICSNAATTYLWDVATTTALKSFTTPNTVKDLAYATTVPLIASAGGGRAMLWELDGARAIIVAGGGNFSGNGIAQQTNDLAAYAFRTLKGRGYNGADIQYLSAFGSRDADSDGLDDVDGAANLTNLQQAIAGSFGAGAGRLLILMIDHGYSTNGFMAYRVNETQTLPSTTLNQWLNDLQTTYSLDVTLVVDSCYSGKIVDDCSTAPAGRKRIVISSTRRDAEAVFVPSPDLSSFMYTFLGSAYMGNSIGEAWRAGLRFFQTFPVANQIPQISDGTTSTTNADREFFGKTWAYGVQSTTNINQFFPAFENWTSSTAVAPGDPVYLFTKVISTQDPTAVQAVIRTPAPSVIAGDPITSLPRVTLVRRSNDSTSSDYHIWETTATGVFTSVGAHTVSFTANFGERLSDPVFSTINVSSGTDPDQTVIRAVVAMGDSATPDINSALGNLGPFIYSTYLSRFEDNAGVHHPEWIDYYSGFSDADKDGIASSANVISSIDNLANGVGRLYMHILGDAKAQGGVRMSSSDILTATALDTALDALQSRQTCAVVLIVDAPYSGAFLNTCKATGGQQRVVMTSGRSTDQALFLPAPLRTSFSEKVMGAALQGNELNTAFNAGKKFFANFKRTIQPQLDDNGSGTYSAADGVLAGTVYVGRRYAFAGDAGSGLPFLLDATTTQTVAPGTMVQYSTTLIEGVVPSRVYLQLVPDITSDTAPIAAVATIELARTSPTGWSWSATFNAPLPAGTYNLALYADYPDSAEVKATEPQFTGLVITGTSGTAPVKDMDGDGFEDAAEIRYGSDPLSAGSVPPSGFPYSSTADSDGDGYKDFYEYELGFDPSSSSSHPSIGDVTGDSGLNGADAIVLKRIAVGTLQMTDYSIANMDLNRDGVVNGADAIILQQFVVHTVTALPTN